MTICNISGKKHVYNSNFHLTSTRPENGLIFENVLVESDDRCDEIKRLIDVGWILLYFWLSFFLLFGLYLLSYKLLHSL